MAPSAEKPIARRGNTNELGHRPAPMRRRFGLDGSSSFLVRGVRMSALSAGGATVLAPPKEANRGGARTAAGRSGPGPLCSRRLHVQFNVVKSGALERALVAAVAIECACPRHALIRADTGNDLDLPTTWPPVCVSLSTSTNDSLATMKPSGREYVLCTRIPQATLCAPRKPLTRPWPFNRTIPRPTRQAAFAISPSTNGRKRSRRRAAVANDSNNLGKRTAAGDKLAQKRQQEGFTPLFFGHAFRALKERGGG